MKRIMTFFVALSVMSTISFAQTTNDDNTTPLASGAKITFEKTTHDFGKVPKGKPVSYQFVFTNTGTEPLTVQNVQKVCGCTVTNWSKNPVLPGQTGTVTAQYNAARVGRFKKPITVISNAVNSPNKLYFEGEVIETPADTGVPTNDNSITKPN